jgi:hypothetical protein
MSSLSNGDDEGVVAVHLGCGVSDGDREAVSKFHLCCNIEERKRRNGCWRSSSQAEVRDRGGWHLMTAFVVVIPTNGEHGISQEIDSYLLFEHVYR